MSVMELKWFVAAHFSCCREGDSLCSGGQKKKRLGGHH